MRSAQTCPPFTGFTQLAHPSRCSRSTLTTVGFSALVFRDHIASRSFSGLQPFSRSIRGSSPSSSSCSGEWDPWSVEYQSFKLAMFVVVLKQRLASFQRLRSSSLTTFEQLNHCCQVRFICEPRTDNRLGRPGPVFLPGLAPVNPLVGLSWNHTSINTSSSVIP